MHELYFALWILIVCFMENILHIYIIHIIINTYEMHYSKDPIDIILWNINLISKWLLHATCIQSKYLK